MSCKPMNELFSWVRFARASAPSNPCGLLIPPRHPGKSSPIIRRAGYTDVHADIELKVLCNPVDQARVECPLPLRVALRAHGAEELEVAGKIPEQVVAEFDAVDELRVVAGFIFIPHRVESGRPSQVKGRRQLHFQRQDEAPFHPAVADALLACGKLHVWRRCERRAPAIIAPEVVFEPEPW